MNARKGILQEPELRSLVLAILLVLLIATLSYRAWNVFGRLSEEQAATKKIVDDTNAVLSTLTDAETGQRGFLLTGEERYLEPYRQAVAQLPDVLSALARATVTRPNLAYRLNQLTPLVTGKLNELRTTIELRRNQGLDAALAVMFNDRGRVLMDRIREKCAELRTISNGRLTRQSEDALSAANRLGLISTIGGAALFVLLILSTVTLRREGALRQTANQDLRKSEAQTRQARDWLQTTIESIGDGVIAADANGKVALLNSVAESLTGWTKEQAAGLPLDQVFVIGNEETGAVVENPVAAVLREGRIIGLADHTSLTAKDGRRIPIEDSAAPIVDAQGAIAGVVLVFRDVSKARAAERSERQAAAALVRQAHLLEQANTELQQFANAASHDLREPLRTITAFTDRLQLRDGLSLDDAESLKFILAGARRMSDLIDALLEYSKSGEIGNRPLRPIAMEEVLAMALDNLREAIDESQAVITYDPLPHIAMDQFHSCQLFQNLIGNALKYRGQDAPRVHISVRKQSDQWLFSVKDNGEGIALEYQRQIFEPFKRLHDRDYPGAGIGLATCKRVVEGYGGRIWVESEPGKGSTFFFTIPAAFKRGDAQDHMPGRGASPLKASKLDRGPGSQLQPQI